MIEDPGQGIKLPGVGGRFLHLPLHKFHDEVATTLPIFEEIVDL